MRNFIVLTESINFIEQNLHEPITREEVAGHCHVSLSMLEKLFSYTLHRSIKEYITKRRMTQAAKDITKTNLNITDIAMKYQFNSVEVFSRAFKRVWNVNPSEFKTQWSFTGIFPKLNYEYVEGGDPILASKKFDFSDAYDFLKERQGSYVLCFDGKHLMAFNETSLKAGDLAILEIASRIDRAATEEMIVLRIGGDEFALITGLYDQDKAQELAEKILSDNGKPIIFEGKELPLSLWCGITTIPSELRYSDFFNDLHQTIMNSKQ